YLLLNLIEETKCLGIDDLFVFFEQSSELHRHGAEINPPYESAILLDDLRRGDYLLPLIDNRPDFKQVNPDVAVCRVFANQFNLVDMLAHVFTTHAQDGIIWDVYP